MKMIFKNILSQRKRNLFLYAEMVIIAIICWVMLDSVMVLIGVEKLPQGYDRDRLVMVEVGGVTRYSPRWKPEYSDTSNIAKYYDAMFNHIKDLPGVESVTRTYRRDGIDGSGISKMGVSHVNNEGDTVMVRYASMVFFNHTEYFETFGMSALPGSPSVEEMSDMQMVMVDPETGYMIVSSSGGSAIITRDLAETLFGKADNYVGRRFGDVKNPEKGTLVVGVVETVRSKHYMADGKIAWTGFPLSKLNSDMTIVVRMADGFNPDRWVRDNKENLIKNFKYGNLYVKYVTTFKKFGDSSDTAIKADSEKRIKYALLLFFLVNLALGVAGTYYLQTRQRSHDAGLMKAYGATGNKIFGMLMGEAMVITVAGWLTGCLIYMNYALEEGLSCGLEESLADFPTGSWMGDFWTHFTVVSVAVLIVMVVIVTIGVAIPARRISRVNPVDAIRSE